MKTAPKLRLFVEPPLAEGISISLPLAQSHYLLHVMRAKAGEEVALFNGRDGEWRAILESEGKKGARLAVQENLRAQPPPPDLWLLFAPVKRTRIDLIVEKATELGASALVPVWTQNTATSRLNDERLAAIAVEAAEQCRRLDVPEIRPALPLAQVLADWPDGRRLIVLDEKGGGRPIAEALSSLDGPLAMLAGPEGGFTETELDGLRATSFAVPVGLGPRILRADTAIIAALACLQAWCGDWRTAPAGPISSYSNLG